MKPSTTNSDRPIGIFDSGVGGLSVLGHVRGELPAEDIVYVADSAFAPYGDKPKKAVEERCVALTRFLIERRGAKAVVVACNTATAAAAATLRSRYTIPIVAMEPGVKPAVSLTKSGVVGVLATSGTLASEKFSSLLDRFGHHVKVRVQPCPGLVECVEAGDLDTPATSALLRGFLEPLLREGCDVIVLGCTHYPFLAAAIRVIAGPDVVIVDTGPAVARQLRRRLEETGLANPDPGRRGTCEFWSSGADEPLRAFSHTVCSKGVVQHLPELFAQCEVTV